MFSPALEKLLGPRRGPEEPLTDRHRDIARSGQAMYEEAFFHLITPLAQSSGLDDVALAGGCAMNSVANGRIRRATLFNRVYVQAAAGDAGGAIGSAFALWHQLAWLSQKVAATAFENQLFGEIPDASTRGLRWISSELMR